MLPSIQKAPPLPRDRAADVDLDVVPLHEEGGQVELELVVEPFALEARPRSSRGVRPVGERHHAGVGRALASSRRRGGSPRCRARRAMTSGVKWYSVANLKVVSLSVPLLDQAVRVRIAVGRQAERNLVHVEQVAVELEPARAAGDRPLVGQVVGHLAEEGELLHLVVVLVEVVDVGRRERAGRVLAIGCNASQAIRVGLRPTPACWSGRRLLWRRIATSRTRPRRRRRPSTAACCRPATSGAPRRTSDSASGS